MKKVTVYIAVKIPPGAESKVEIDWDRNEKELQNRCKRCKIFENRTRVEFLKVEVEI